MARNRELSRHAKVILFTQLLAHCVTATVSLIVMVPMSIHQEHFRGHCILFSTGTWQEADGQFKVDWASQAYCNFTIFVSVVAFVTALASFFRTLQYLKKNQDASFFAAFCQVVADFVTTIMTMVAALFVTCGFSTWCDQMTERFEKCQDAAGNDIDKADGIDSNQFFFHMGLCQAGMWMSFVACFLALASSFVRLRKYHDLENLRVSMAKERKRLLNEDLVADVPNPDDDEDDVEEEQRQRTTSGSSSSEKRRGGKKSKKKQKQEQQQQQQQQEDDDRRHHEQHQHEVEVEEVPGTSSSSSSAFRRAQKQQQQSQGQDKKVRRGQTAASSSSGATVASSTSPRPQAGNEIYVCSEQRELFDED